jgi:hypothetical protein
MVDCGAAGAPMGAVDAVAATSGAVDVIIGSVAEVGTGSNLTSVGSE